MIRKPLPFLSVLAILTVFLVGCSSSTNGTGTSINSASAAPVSITMTDDPPAGVSVLFFQVSLTAATLTPESSSDSSVSLLSNNTPIQIDVTQLQALSAFLSTASVPSESYSGLNLTFANPQLVIFNRSDSSLGSTCAVGSVCQLTPAFDNNTSSLNFTSSPFPVMVSASSPLGFVIDFHLNTVIQSDLSVNLAATNGVTVSELPPAPTPPQFGFLTGTVGTVTASSNQFTLQTRWGRKFTIATTSSTTFNNFPSSACTTPGIGCLAQGQIVKVEVSSVASDGNLTASEVNYVQAAAAQTVEGIIVSIPPLPLPAGETIIDLILHQSPTGNANLPIGGIASVAVWAPGSGSNPATTFSIDNNGFAIPSGYTFASSSDLTVGQTVQVTVTPGTVSNTGGGPSTNAWGPPPSLSFTASAVELEPSQMTGSITAVDSSTTSFTLGVGGPFFAAWPMSAAVSSYDVATTSQTTYTGFSPDNFGGLANGQFVSVNGWLFPPSTSGGSPTIAAQSVLMRPTVTPLF